jgi:hypothetical protein
MQNLNNISVTPVFDNSSEYPFNGFDLRYNVDIADGQAPVPNSLFEHIYINENTSQYKYKENVLPQYSQTYEPFRLSSLPKVNSRYIIDAKASYSGAKFAYHYKVRLWLRHIPKRPNQSIDDWKISCKEVIRDMKEVKDVYDAFLFCDNQIINDFGVDYGAMNSTNVTTDNASKTSENQKPEVNSDLIIKQNKASNSMSNSASSTNQAKETSISIPNPKVSSLDETEMSPDLEYTSFSTFSEDSICYLSLKANKILSSDNVYHVVYHNENSGRNDGYEIVEFRGNDSNKINIKLIREAEVDYITIPKRDHSKINDITIEQCSDGVELKNNSPESLIVYYRIHKSIDQNCVLNSGKLVKYTNVSPSDISIIDTFTYEIKPKSIWEIIFFPIISIICLIGGIASFVNLKKEEDKSEKIEGFLLGLGLLIIFIIMILCIIS